MRLVQKMLVIEIGDLNVNLCQADNTFLTATNQKKPQKRVYSTVEEITKKKKKKHMSASEVKVRGNEEMDQACTINVQAINLAQEWTCQYLCTWEALDGRQII